MRVASVGTAQITPALRYWSNVRFAPLGHTKLESTVRYLGIEIDDALAMSEQIDV